MNHDQPPRRIDRPEPCFVRLRPRRHAPFAAARIFTALGMLSAEIAGVPADVDHVWTHGEFIDETEYLFLMEAPPAGPDQPRLVSARGLAEAIREQAEQDWLHTQPIR